MLTKEEILEQLKDRNLKVVAERNNLHFNTIYNLVNKGTASTTTLEKLSSYLQGQCEVVSRGS